MKPYKWVINITVLVVSIAWTAYCLRHMQHIGDFYWLTSIPTAVISVGGCGFLIVLGLIKWFEVDT